MVNERLSIRCLSAERRAADRRRPGAEEEDSQVPVGLEPRAPVAPQRRAVDAHRPGTVVADEEDRATALVRVVVRDDRAGDGERVEVAVVVDRASAAAAGGAAAGRVGTVPDGLVAGHHTVEYSPRDPDARQRTAVGAHAVGEGTPEHVHRQVVRLAQCPYRRSAEVRTRCVATVVYEPRIDDPQPSTAVEDGTAAPALGHVPGRVAAREGDVLDDQFRRLLVLAVRGGPALGLVARVLVQDPARPAAVEGHLAAAVEHDAGYR